MLFEAKRRDGEVSGGLERGGIPEVTTAKALVSEGLLLPGSSEWIPDSMGDILGRVEGGKFPK